MAMSVGQEGGDDAPMSDINTTPLVDVMLVLLIIFLITVPVALKSVPVRMANMAYQPTVSKAENVVLTIREEPDGTCGVYMGMSRVHANELSDRAATRLIDEVKAMSERDKLNRDKYPEVHIRADKDTPYRCVGGAVYAVQQVGFPKVGFISEPKLVGGS